jgi:hypothetical protein
MVDAITSSNAPTGADIDVVEAPGDVDAIVLDPARRGRGRPVKALKPAMPAGPVASSPLCSTCDAPAGRFKD